MFLQQIRINGQEEWRKANIRAGIKHINDGAKPLINPCYRRAKSEEKIKYYRRNTANGQQAIETVILSAEGKQDQF